MSRREQLKKLVSGIEKANIEEIEPDEWDLKMIADAEENNGGSTISFEEILEKEGLTLACIKKLVLAWDPDFTKLTLAERRELEEVEQDIKEHGTIPHDAINWEVPPEPDEIEAIAEGRRDRAEHGTIPHDAINWDE